MKAQTPTLAAAFAAVLLGSPACSGDPEPDAGNPRQGAAAAGGSYETMSREQILAMDPTTWTKACAKQVERMAKAMESVRDVPTAQEAVGRLAQLRSNLQSLLELRRGNIGKPPAKAEEMFQARLRHYFARLDTAGQNLQSQPELQTILKPEQDRLLQLFGALR